MTFILKNSWVQPWVPTLVKESLGIGHLDGHLDRFNIPYTKEEEAFERQPYFTGDRHTDFNEHKIFSATWDRSDRTAVADVIQVHGLHDHATRWAATPWPKAILDAGFRVTNIDLIGHGRSSGLHGAFTSIDEQVDAVKTVLLEVVKKLPPTKSKKVFLLGGSLAGLILLTYSVTYGKDPKAKPDGMVVLCPLVDAAADSRPSYVVELIAKGLSYFTPFLPLAEANRGKNSTDPRMEELFFEDPLTYHGRLRIGTALALLRGFERLQKNLENVETPFIVIHGDADRATSPEGSKLLHAKSRAKDKTLRIVPGQQHDLCREPKSREILADSIEWLKKRV
ncbi:Alpha/Beta hydrolase protein [Fimicolochytrium jonesii]|uniref:Alpha/Beta hydrolase protein n=1 Tax=Fimicolochytrium jonesii TaxID=1396493 RepID=UPI0022FE65C8|nr:Alpha/Beta hydrolase protein [Fimicolochytrium jonesii]KAI8824852.1 Alpha/Beta hydrolase protein [Fimicolochytrium jonesii]